jgi:hypothetical protein
MDGRLTVSPQGTNFILTSDIPDSKADVFVLDCFDVEAFLLEYCIMIGIVPIVGMVVTEKGIG